MIVRIQRGGKSFKWLGTYLTHDTGKAASSERVAWTHTFNLANDYVPSAIDEMYWTCRAADQLKREAGVGTGGRRVERPVKHCSLNWHPSQQPTKAEMLKAVQDFLRHMGWEQHQAVLVAHNDRPHQHVHVMVNAISPVDGRSLDTGHEWNRAERWREDFDRQRRRNFCQQDNKPYEEREDAPTREKWQAFKDAEKAFEQEEAARAVRAPDYFDRHDPAHWKSKEWDALRAQQKDQRTAFFDGGKKAYRDVRNAVFREVRTEFRDQWKTWFKLRDDGTDFDLLGAIKAGILERQKAELEKRRDEACKELREGRDKEYEAILQQQREERAELKDRQQDGLRTFALLDYGDERAQPSPLHGDGEQLKEGFKSAARETTRPKEPEREKDDEREFAFDGTSRPETFKVRDGLDSAGSLGLGVLGALGDIAERLLDEFTSGKPSPPPRRKDDDKAKESANDNRQAAASARQRSAEERAAEEAARLYEYWEERRRSRSRDRD